MSKAAVEQVLGKLILDSEFRAAVYANPGSALANYDLTPEEMQSLSQVDKEEMHQAVSELDQRISKAKLGEYCAC
jgi:hypothetical protein